MNPKYIHNLPQPEPIALAHSKKVLEFIRDKIQQKGAMTFADYMQHVLYAPGLGYYSAGAQKFGAAGDFVTAPEISPLFSQCLALQCAQVLGEITGGDILELGAGSGVMAAEIITLLSKMNCLPQRYFILEVSADLRERQQILLQQRVPDYFSHIIWLDTLPENFRGIMLANEVVDAMPVQRFILHEATIQEFYVDLDQCAQLCWKLDQPSTTELADHLLQLHQSLAPDIPAAGYISEVNLYVAPWLKSLSNCLQQGIILVIDYGFPRHEYYHPQRNQGTLMCHYRHFAHGDPFIFPGLQDITAHVDFTALAQAAVNNQLQLAGYTSQAGFLLSCGLPQLFDSAVNNSRLDEFNLSQQMKKLLLPTEMGELFKVMVLTRKMANDLLGFRLENRVGKLYMKKIGARN